MNLIARDRCVITHKEDLEPLYSFKNFPVFMGCTRQDSEKDLRADMNWWISRESGMIQLNKLLPLNVLYPESHGAGCVGKLWLQHHMSFASFVHKTSPLSVFEIGGAHGILAKEYQVFGDLPWTILEPNPTPVEGNRARFIKGFFDDSFIYKDSFDTVVHSHLLEHIYEPDEFMSRLSLFIEEGKRLIFSLPNMQVMLDRKYTNCINFEHTVFMSEPYIEFMLAKHGFRLLSREYFMDDHSIFYATIRDSSVKPISLPTNLYNRNKELYINYVHYHEKLIESLNKRTRELESPIYLFGAHVFSQYLIAFGLDTSRIVSLLDNDLHKQGQRLYGTNLMVNSPLVLKNIQNPHIILKAGVYNHEVKSYITDQINSSAVFLE